MKLLKRSFICLIIICCFTGIKAQTWFQTGDLWIYDYSTVWGRSGFEEVWVEGDTIINNQTCKILNNKRSYVNIYSQANSNDTVVIIGEPFFVYEEAEKVYGYFEDEFKLLYDFSDIGNLMYTREGEGHPDDDCDLELAFGVSDTSSMVFNNINRRVLNYISLFPVSGLYGDHDITVIEGIGIVSKNYNNEPVIKFGHIIPGRSYPCTYDTERWSFCSFTSQGEEYNPENEDCYYLPLPVSSSQQETVFSKLSLDPNPTSTYFSIRNSLNIQFDKINIYNLSGKIVKVINHVVDEIYIDDLIPGIYIVEMKMEEKFIYRKLLIEGDY